MTKRSPVSKAIAVIVLHSDLKYVPPVSISWLESPPKEEIVIATAWWQIAAAGMCGPLLVELAKLATPHNAKRILKRWRNPVYWVSFCAFVGLGGIIATLTLYDAHQAVSIYHALHIGATSPLIAAAYASSETAPVRRSKRSGRIVQGTDHRDANSSFGWWDAIRQVVRW